MPFLSRTVAWLTASLVLVGLVVQAAAQPAPAASAASSQADRPTRLFLGPTARLLPAGEGYVVLHGGLVPAFQVGLSDRFSIGAGTFYFGNGNVWVTPKVQVLRRGATAASATLVHFVLPGEGSLGFAFGSVTHDGAAGGVTLGVGVAYVHGWDDDDEWASGGPLFMVGGDRRLGRRLTFLSENYIVAGAGAVLINGVRASWGRFELDAGAMIFMGDGVLGGPVLNLGWRF